MKKFVIPFVALFVVAISLVSWRSQSKVEGATVINDQFCLLYNSDQVLVAGETSHAVITPSGNTTFRCQATVSNDQGKAVRFDDFLCSTNLGFTTDSHETISANGQATLTCRINGN